MNECTCKGTSDERDQVVALGGAVPHRVHGVAERPQDVLDHVEQLALPDLDHDPQLRLPLQFERPARHCDRAADRLV